MLPDTGIELKNLGGILSSGPPLGGAIAAQATINKTAMTPVHKKIVFVIIEPLEGKLIY